MGVAESRDELQGLLVVMASLSHGLEQVLGRGAETVTFRAGRTVGLKSGAGRSRRAISWPRSARWREALKASGIEWPFEVWKPAAAPSFVYEKDGKQAVKLVFRNCMVRCALFRYGHEQKQSLCMMNHGLFCGYVQKITGKRAELEILHAGENACLKELLLHRLGGHHGQSHRLLRMAVRLLGLRAFHRRSAREAARGARGRSTSSACPS